MAKKEYIGEERKQKRLFKKRRGGVVLSEDEVLAIKAGRKKLKKEMKARKCYNRRDFELTASSMGLYFDKRRFIALLWWLFSGKGLAFLLASLLLTGGALYLMSMMTKMRGHFTISMDDDMFRNGFVLSETVGFEKPTTYLFAEPAVDVPCISISQLPENIDRIDGNHSETYFAYTFYVRNEGEDTVGYEWSLRQVSESLDISRATWIMLFEDGEMAFFAEANADGKVEALPAIGDDTRGYLGAPLSEFLKDPGQYEKIRSVSTVDYYRALPKMWESESVVTSGIQTSVAPMEVHKYTVVIWLEGDDPDCTDALIGGNLGLEVYMQLIDPTDGLAERK